MNTYYIGGMPVTDELYHHGILGMKWGVRRYQNPDGTLTPAGKKRYYGAGEGTDTGGSGGTSRAHYKVNGFKQEGIKKYESEQEQKKLADMLTTNAGSTKKEREKNAKQIAKSDQVQMAAKDLKSLAKEDSKNRDEYYKQEAAVWSDKKLYDEYKYKAIDKAMAEAPNSWGSESRDELFKYFDWYDSFQGSWDPIEILKVSDDPRGNALRESEKKYMDSSKKLHDASKQYADKFLGEYGNQTLSNIYPWVSTKVDANTRLTSAIVNESRKKAHSIYR